MAKPLFSHSCFLDSPPNIYASLWEEVTDTIKEKLGSRLSLSLPMSLFMSIFLHAQSVYAA